MGDVLTLNDGRSLEVTVWLRLFTGLVWVEGGYIGHVGDRNGGG